MKPVNSLLTTVFLFCSAVSYSQVPSSDSSLSSQNTGRLRKELSEHLMKKAAYPREALQKHSWGDVILSCELNQAGKFSMPLIKKSPDLLLSKCSVEAMNNLDEKWTSEKADYVTANKEYLFVFRYRIYMNAMPVDNKARAMKLFNKAKYEKAAKVFNMAIRDNEYDYELYSFSAKCKEAMGNTEGAVQDYARALKLWNEVMAVVDVIAMGRTSTIRVSGSRIVAVPAEQGRIYP